MIKTKDHFFAGVISGLIGGLFIDILALLLLLIGFKIRTPWGDMTALLFRPPQMFTWQANILGLIAATGVSITNGIIIAFLLKFTGFAHRNTKSITVCIASGYFGFMILYPALGFHATQHSVLTVYIATISYVPYGILMAYLLNKFLVYNEEEKKTEPIVLVVEMDRPSLFQRIRKKLKS